METRKTIRDIKTSDSNIISDMVSTQPVTKKRIKKTEVKTYSDTSDEIITPEYPPSETYDIDIPREIKKESNKRYTKILSFRKIRGLLSEIKPIYLIAFALIVIGIIVLIFVPSSNPSNTANSIIEKNKAEAEIVKNKFSKHLVLPQNEEIDIRKITSKMEDPFFKDASVGDYLIIFYKNRIAYIYSIDKDIIINAGVVFIDPKTATTTSTTKQ